MSNGGASVKLVCLGMAGVGKTCLLKRAVEGADADLSSVSPTVAATFLSKKVRRRSDDALVELLCWDLAGQENFMSLAPIYFRGASAALVVFSVVDGASFIHAKSYIDLVQRSLRNIEHSVSVLVAHKIDIDESEWRVDLDEARALADDNQMLYAEASAYSGAGVEDIFERIAAEQAIFEHVIGHASHAMLNIYRKSPDAEPDDDESTGCCS
jgi:Ras-related protein Rab-5C